MDGQWGLVRSGDRYRDCLLTKLHKTLRDNDDVIYAVISLLFNQINPITVYDKLAWS